MGHRIQPRETYLDPRSGLKVAVESVSSSGAVVRYLTGPLAEDRAFVPLAVWSYGLARGTCVRVQS